MKKKFSRVGVILATLCLGALIGYACSEAVRGGSPLVQIRRAQADELKTSSARPKANKRVRRFGQVIGLKPKKQIIYNMLHANPWGPVNKMIRESNIQNYSIYETELDGKLYLFAYFEYTGADFEADMAKMAENKTTQEWWKLTDPCQIRLPGTPEGDQWKGIEEVYHLD